MLTSLIENVLNRGLPRSPRARELCAALAGRKLAIEVRGMGPVVVESDGHGLRLTRGPGEGTDAQLSGTPLALLALGGASAEAVIQRGEVQIRGDAEIAQQFRELGRFLRPDVEEELAQAIGDVPAHQMGRFARGALSWGRRAAATTTRNFAEYFAHERGDLVPRAEGRQFLSGVDVLREDVDRLDARVERLAQRLTAQPPRKPDP